MLVKKRLVVLPVVAILTIVLLHFFSTNYLYIILIEHLDADLSAITQMVLFAPVSSICDWAIPITAFVLYRKELKRQNV